MKYTALAAAMIVFTTHAQAREGRVIDNSGAPIAGARVKAASSKQSVLSDEQGRFVVAEGIEELHITAPGYSHDIVHLHERDQNILLVTLTPTVIEQVDVIGLPIHASIIESAMPVSVLSGDALRDQQAATLGDTLERQPGINSNFHGGVASTPVIRGLSGPRVLITQNSLDVSDVSRVGPDHAVASEVSTAQQVEILRGPATLFYGSGAIGGVVNVVDHRVPNDSETRAEALVSYDSVNSQNLVSANATSGTDRWAVYVDGFWRDADDYKVPVAPEREGHEETVAAEHHKSKRVANSGEESSGFTLGSSYLLDNGFVGVALERLDRDYGIPGHAHGEHENEEGGDEAVYADLEQDRYQLQSELTIDSNWLRAINTRAAYTDYTHSEIEGGEVGTVFSNETSELRLDMFHQEWDHWKGGLNLHYKRSEVSAQGEEAFTPPSITETVAVALMEERHSGAWLFQFGARAEHVTITADSVPFPHLELHRHEPGTVGDEDDGEHEDGETALLAADQDFTPFSVSVGAVWEFASGYNVGVSLSRAERAPSAAEWVSFGPHIGTQTYEVGAYFELHEEDGEAHFELSDTDLALEKSNNIDLTFRKYEGDLGIIINAFINKIDDYYFQENTGYFAESEHAHEGEQNADPIDSEDEHEEELPIYLFTHKNAEFYGLEAQLIWQLSRHWQTTFFSDFVHAELSDGRYLPRTPPLRFGADLDFTYGRLKADINWMHYTRQDKLAELETTTDAYDKFDASVAYQLPLTAMDVSAFLKVENIGDTEARVHTSFIKDIAPRPGRNLSLGIRASF